jgi:triacylglycerol lipase
MKRPRQRMRAHLHAATAHSHISEVYAINITDTRLTDEIIEFVKTGK